MNTNHQNNFLLIGAVLILATTAQAQIFFPGAKECAKLRDLVSRHERVAQLSKPVIRGASEALDDAPQPLKHIIYEGRLDTDPQRIATVASLLDMQKIDLLIQAGIATGETRYAKKTREYVLAWTAAYEPTGNPINEVKLLPLLVAYEWQRNAFSPVDQKRIDSWMKTLALVEMQSAKTRPQSTHNNWHPKRLELVAAIGKILSEETYVRYAVDGAKSYVAASLRPDGSSVDFEQRDALSYHIGGIKPLLRLAALLKSSGFDLYSYTAPNGASVKKSVNFVAPFAKGEITHGEFARTTADLDKKRAAAGIPHYQPGRLFEPASSLSLFEMATAFEPSYAALVARLASSSDEVYPTWNVAMVRAGWLCAAPDL
ncbi:MAG: alginate lyase family protein [Gloeobacteraceae cyanobacterium ES-bin-144]|nr:alginate lyase family protein [Verrucomicrobiales bacterium]